MQARRIVHSITRASCTALVAAGCVNAPPPASTAPREVVPAPSTATERPSASAAGLVLRTHEPAVVALPDASRAALVGAPFVMLVLPDPYAARSLVMCETHWCSADYREDDFSVNLFATDVWVDGATAEDLAALEPTTASVRGHGARVLENEGIWSLSWNEHDVAFSLSVECGREDDARCADEHFLVGLSAELIPAHLPPLGGTTVGTRPGTSTGGTP